MKRKIAILCNYELLPERVGGMDYFFWQFDAKCKENNIQADWFFPNQSDHGEYSKLTIFDSRRTAVEFFFLDYCSRNNSEYKYVITHFIELCTPFFKKAKQISNAKIISVDHNPRPINGYSFQKKIKKRSKGLLYSKYIDTFIGVSEYTKKELIKDFGRQIKKKTQVIHNGIALDEIKVRQKRNETKPSFLTASHLRESKGIQDLIQAVFLLPETIKNEIAIDVYGDGPYRIQLQNQVRSHGLEACFNFRGSSALLKSLYCNYDYMIQPTHMECFSLSILESLAANVPVITTNVGGNEEAVMNTVNGFVYKAKDVKALVAILEKVYLGIEKIDGNTRIAIENHFSLERMVNQHFGLLIHN
jgi:glycosyltransferase involved in cell wall biosynthesis